MSGQTSRGYLEEILRELDRERVRFVIAGGVAAVLHGVERTTMDLDIALDMAPDNVDRFSHAMRRLGLEPLVPLPIEVLSDPASVRAMVEEKGAIVFMLADPQMPLRKVDVFLTEELRYDGLATDAAEVEIAGMSLRLVSLERLLELKRAVDPPRDKDVFDIRALERLAEEGTEND